jgi:hypothetical protein
VCGRSQSDLSLERILEGCRATRKHPTLPYFLRRYDDNDLREVKKCKQKWFI